MDEKKKVLIIEDDRALRLYLAAQLSYFNFDTILLEDVASLSEVIERERPDVIITDIVLAEGELAGPEALSKLKNIGTELPPVITMSGRSDFAARLAALRAGARAYFPKPIDCASIADKINEIVEPSSESPLYVLIVEDSPSLSAYYSAILQSAGMETKEINDPSQVMDALAEFPAELILMDVYMPDCNGPELAGVLRQQERFISIPIVFLSSESDVTKQLSAMGSGGDDFLIKPIDPTHLVTSVRLRAARYRDMRRLMVRDSLTGLYNHSTIETYLEKETSRAIRHGLPLSMAMLDVDHFKRVNDSYGHPFGDIVLRNLSRLLLKRLRKTDIVGRYGGEEFCVLMPHTDGQQAVAVMDEVRDAFSKLVMRNGNQDVSVTFSCGVADLESGKESGLTQAADKALYQAKQAGRNRVCVA